MIILGISAFYHDSAACILVDGNIVAAAQEERFSRKKHDPKFPTLAINYCLAEARLNPDDINYVVFYDKPFSKFERILETYISFAPRGLKSFATSMPVWVKDKLFQKSIITSELSRLSSKVNWTEKLRFAEHHISHAASAFFPSPFRSAAILTMDGVGEWTTTSFSVGEENTIQVEKEIHFPHSLGLLYSAFTYYTGFRVNSGEYKLMGLAPYGDPKYVKEIKDNLIDIAADGSFHLNMDYFGYCTDLKMTSKKFNSLFGGSPRLPDSVVTQREMDLAASIQSVTEEVVVSLAKEIKIQTGLKNICLAGGVALNCVANGKLLESKIFENIWVQPASGDAGGALGAALASYYLMLEKPRKVSKNCLKGSYLGPTYTDAESEKILNKLGAKYEVLSEKNMISRAAQAIANGRAVGWMNGRMEFGPRALGNRSILADPRSKTMQKNLNLKVKYRESFRPFAPSILAEDLNDWFETTVETPYMLMVSKIQKKHQIKMDNAQKSLFGIDKLNVTRSTIPAVTHVDYTSRIQTVHKKTNPKYYKLISEFKKITGCPILVNTSFNVRGEPIVCSPKDAFNCFMGTDLDVLVIGNIYLEKDQQNKNLVSDYKDKYELD